MKSLCLLLFLIGCADAMLSADEIAVEVMKIANDFGQCEGCLDFMSWVAPGNEFANINDIKTIVAGICGLLGEDTAVCAAFVETYEDTIEYFLTRTDISQDDICFAAYDDGEACGPGNLTIPEPTWTLDFPATDRPCYDEPVAPAASTDLGKVLFITDIHMDLDYTVGKTDTCDAHLCCRSDSGEPTDASDTAGVLGAPGSCGTPFLTLNYLLGNLSATEEFDWIVMTGDIPPHDTYARASDFQVESLETLYDVFYTHFPNTPVFFSLGNHEALPVNQYIPPFEGAGGMESPMSWLYDDIVTPKWRQWLPDTTEATLSLGGYWSWDFATGLKVISINSNYGQGGQGGDWYMIFNNTDATGMLQWLIDELQDAEDNNMKVWLLSHHPYFTLDYYNDRVFEVLQRYYGSIIIWLNGHTHRDEVTLFYDQSRDDMPALVSHTGPAKTAYDENSVNMGYQILYVDNKRSGATYAVVDFETYIFNVTEGQSTNELVWELEFSAQDAYGMESLFPRDYHDLVARLEGDETGTMASLYKYYQTKSTELSACDSDCIEELVSDSVAYFDGEDQWNSQGKVCSGSHWMSHSSILIGCLMVIAALLK